MVVNEVEPVSLDMETMALTGPAKANVKATGSETGNSSWDADWAVPEKTARSAAFDYGLFPQKPAAASARPPDLFPPSAVPGPPQLALSQQSAISFEWPSPASFPSIITKTPSAFSLNAKTSNLGGMSSGFSNPKINSYQTPSNMHVGDDSDPFSNWLPQSCSTSTQSSWDSGSIFSINQNLSSLETSKGSSNSLLNAKDGTTSSAQQVPKNETDDFSAFFSSSPRRQEAPLRLAPPPASGLGPSGLGKGRGRNPIRPPQVTHLKTNSSEQPPILNLL